ncbi:phosphotransferase [Fervidobacterium thailandense]|uniref:Phosphotransferase n=2 Tax=Fervidobacterium thailandense TaxID=1008305 RepID=A0A1E3G241_9BACT|nr:phosphotransferase [Fervidobacterium thailandense]
MVPSIICAKELEIFSITDHNSARNVPVFQMKCGSKLLVPGIEIHTVEDVHVLGYFSKVDDALKVSRTLEELMDKFEYDPERFGYQVILDEEENFSELVEYYLGFPTNVTLDDAIELIRSHNGIAVLAHVDRKFGAMYQLGLIPEGTNIVEVRSKETWLKLKEKGYVVLTSSDAHTPDEVGIRKSYLEVFDGEPISVEMVIRKIVSGQVRTLWEV